jgi:tetratricopeptide (TPR) repeat protein
MKHIILLFVLFSLKSNGQTDLQFNKKFIQSEDKWVAFSADSIGNHLFGFIYIDAQAGLTLNYSGSFKIDSNGKYILKEKPENTQMIYRLQPNSVLVAFIPDDKLIELNVNKTPEWLKFYKNNEDSIERLYRWGYLYNGWNECEKALTFLEKAEKINSKFKGLQTELAFSHNYLKNYKKAEIALMKALADDPNDCYTLKELAYTYRHLNKLEASAEVYYKMASCKEKNFLQETAYNLAFKYFELKDKQNFLKWNKEVRKWGSNTFYTKNLDLIEKEYK